MSKSRGNVVLPQKVSGTLGAEILRLWVAATDYSGELSISDEILKRVVESYRRIRNTLRFLLSNVADFNRERDAVRVADMVEIDRYAIALARKLARDVGDDYARYEFHWVVQRLQNFCSEDLGGFYLDILKDRLYTAGRGSHARRSAQTALHYLAELLLRLMAPVLSFTAEEAWRLLHAEDPSIFCHTWIDVLPQAIDEEALLAAWLRLRALRVPVQKELEALRQQGAIGSSLQAEVMIEADAADYALLADFGDDLRFVLITSAATVVPSTRFQLTVTRSAFAKCERCWHYRADVNANPNPEHPGLCSRCIANLFGDGEPRTYA